MLFIPNYQQFGGGGACCVASAHYKQMRPETQRQLRPGLNTKPSEVALCL